MKKIDFISLRQAIRYHEKTIKETNGILGLRDKRLLESAIMQPQMTIFGKYVYKNIFEMAAAYCFHIIQNHPFIDGNKRAALLITLVFLKKNGYIFKPETNLYQLMVDIASSKITKEEIVVFMQDNLIALDKHTN